MAEIINKIIIYLKYIINININLENYLFFSEKYIIKKHQEMYIQTYKKQKIIKKE
jgi:hypothetical protein